jgi:hypothetical protein
MDEGISHSRAEETAEAKALWFRSLPLSERMEMLCAFTDLALEVNPGVADRKDARTFKGRIQILSKE